MARNAVHQDTTGFLRSTIISGIYKLFSSKVITRINLHSSEAVDIEIQTCKHENASVSSIIVMIIIAAVVIVIFVFFINMAFVIIIMEIMATDLTKGHRAAHNSISNNILMVVAGLLFANDNIRVFPNFNC